MEFYVTLYAKGKILMRREFSNQDDALELFSRMILTSGATGQFEERKYEVETCAVTEAFLFENGSRLECFYQASEEFLILRKQYEILLATSVNGVFDDEIYELNFEMKEKHFPFWQDYMDWRKEQLGELVQDNLSAQRKNFP